MEAKHFIGARTFMYKTAAHGIVSQENADNFFNYWKSAGRLRFTPRTATPEAWDEMCAKLDLPEGTIGSIYSLSHPDDEVMLVRLDEKSFTNAAILP